MARQENQEVQGGLGRKSMLTIQMFQLRHLVFLSWNP
jgi:hypothetical protein